MKRRLEELLARLGASALDLARSDRWLGWLASAQHARTVLDEAQGAFWHLTAMPSRRDIRLIARRVGSLSRRVVELERLVTQLEQRSTSSPKRPGGAP